MVGHGMARSGRAGVSRHGEDRYGTAWCGWLGNAWMVGHVEVRQAWLGAVRHVLDGEARQAGLGNAGYGAVGRGMAG